MTAKHLYALTMLSFIIVGGVALISLKVFTDQFASAIQRQQRFEDVRVLTQQLRSELLSHNRESLLYGLTDADEHLQKRENSMAQLYSIPIQIEKLTEGSDELQDKLREVFAAARAYLEERARLRNSELDPVQRYVKSAVTLEEAEVKIESFVELLREADARGRATVRETNRRVNTVSWIGLSLLLSIVAASLWVFNAYVFRPLTGLSQAINAENRVFPKMIGPAASEIQQIRDSLHNTSHHLMIQRESQMTYFAGFAHDLRSPLSALKMAVEYARQSDKPMMDDAEIVGIIERQVTFLDRMLSDLIEVSRAEAGSLMLRPELTDLCQIARDSTAVFRNVSDKHILKLNVPDCPIIINADPIRMTEVLNNLISNAIKYSPSGGEVELSLSDQQQEVEISVVDHGIGIPAEDIEKIFQPYVRSKNASGTAIPGVGLGLSITRKIVEAHGGGMELDSSEAGTRFTVRLPRQDN